MKANEFVKKFGVDAIKHDLSGYFKDEKIGTIQVLTHEKEYIEVDGDNLKRIIESHDLVEKVISDHNKSFKECQIDTHGLKSFVKKNPKIYPKRLKQAIYDVESCQ